jgi:FkbM family methyltransferase
MSAYATFLSRLVGSKLGRHYLRKISNQHAFQPIHDIISDRLEITLRTLVDLGFSPELVIDIGAHSGHWTELALPTFPKSRFVMLEAQTQREADLKRVCDRDPSRITYQLSLLGETRAEAVPFHVMGTGSSLYPEQTSFARTTIILEMTTLDTVLQRETGSVFVKLDVQGAELDILRGARETLKRTDAILLEASLVEYNRGAPRIAEVIDTMRKWGFNLFDICDLARIGPILAQVDLLFARSGSAIEASVATIIGNYGRKGGVGRG